MGRGTTELKAVVEKAGEFLRYFVNIFKINQLTRAKKVVTLHLKV